MLITVVVIVNAHFLIQILNVFVLRSTKKVELWEDCYCECYNDTDGNGICDEDEEKQT